MRKFEKISFEQFQKDVADDEALYEEYKTPNRETHFAAGYDFHAIKGFTINPGEIAKIPSGIKATMEDDEVLLLVVRGSKEYKYNIRLCNQVGVVDKDYYNNRGNEGHIWIGLQNEGKAKYVVKKGDKIAQGIFVKYLLTEDDEQKRKMKRLCLDDGYLKNV